MRLLPSAVLAALALMLPVPPATAADSATYLVIGNGVISPGLTVVPIPQAININAVATVVRSSGTVTNHTCGFSGVETLGSIALGVGNMTGGCGPFWCDLWLTARVAVEQTWVCVSSVNLTTQDEMHCVWTPGDVNPTTRFSIVCRGTATRAP